MPAHYVFRIPFQWFSVVKMSDVGLTGSLYLQNSDHLLIPNSLSMVGHCDIIFLQPVKSFQPCDDIKNEVLLL